MLSGSNEKKSHDFLISNPSINKAEQVVEENNEDEEYYDEEEEYYDEEEQGTSP